MNQQKAFSLQLFMILRTMISDLGGKFTIILIEQYIEFAKEVCDDFIVLSRGAICASGPKFLDAEIETRFLKV